MSGNEIQRWRRVGLLMLAVSWLGCTRGQAGVNDSGPLNKGDLESYALYFAGIYSVIGRLPGSSEAYCGTVVIAAKGKEFTVTRTIHGETTQGRAFIDLDASGNRIFLMQFTQAGHRYDAAFLYQSNYDHYPRLTGHVTKPGESKESNEGHGTEALFPADDPACAVREQ